MAAVHREGGLVYWRVSLDKMKTFSHSGKRTSAQKTLARFTEMCETRGITVHTTLPPGGIPHYKSLKMQIVHAPTFVEFADYNRLNEEHIGSVYSSPLKKEDTATLSDCLGPFKGEEIMQDGGTSKRSPRHLPAVTSEYVAKVPRQTFPEVTHVNDLESNTFTPTSLEALETPPCVLGGGKNPIGLVGGDTLALDTMPPVKHLDELIVLLRSTDITLPDIYSRFFGNGPEEALTKRGRRK